MAVRRISEVPPLDDHKKNPKATLSDKQSIDKQSITSEAPQYTRIEQVHEIHAMLYLPEVPHCLYTRAEFYIRLQLSDNIQTLRSLRMIREQSPNSLSTKKEELSPLLLLFIIK